MKAGVLRKRTRLTMVKEGHVEFVWGLYMRKVSVSIRLQPIDQRLVHAALEIKK